MSSIAESTSPESQKGSIGSIESHPKKPFPDSPYPTSAKRHSEMEDVINHLADMRDKRDKDLQALKETIRECKAQMAELMGETPNSPRSFSFSCRSSPHGINWQNPAIWKLCAGTLLMLYLLGTNLCYKIVPPLPKFYHFVFFSHVLFHLFLTAIAPLMIRVGRSLGALNERSIQFYSDHVQKHKNAISAATNAIAMIHLKMMRCSYGCGCGSCLQLMITAGLFIAELAAACDNNLPFVNEESKFDYHLTIAILLNLTLTFLL